MANNPITINQGWNWIGFPSNVSVELNSALANLTPQETDLIKTRSAFATYLTSMGGWFGTLTSLTPGVGYMYQSNNSESFEFVYSNSARGTQQPREVQDSSHWEMSVGEYSDNATLIGVIVINGEEQRDENLIVGAFVDDRCVGQSEVLYVEQLDRYYVFLTYFGNENDEITFRLYNEVTNMEYSSVESSIAFAPNSMVGTVNDPYRINFNFMNVDGIFSEKVELFPNPVEPNSKLKVSLNDVDVNDMEVEIVNTLGVAVHKNTYHAMTADIKAPSIPGIYIVKITEKKGAIYYGKLIVE